MKIFLSKSKLVKITNIEKNLGFVPTMGAIHSGHVSLIRKSISQCNKTIVSIFINKPQFNRINDFRSYPRVLKRDISILKKLKVDYLYLPSNKQIYPSGQNKNIKISPFAKKLCGKSRPGHFEAVVDVIDRFIKIIKPKKIYLGEKDMQQLKIIEDFVKKNNIKIKVIGCKIIREKNGIAFSSRNSLLSEDEKIVASNIFNFLFYKKKIIINNKLSINYIRKKIIEFGAKEIDYIKMMDINKIVEPYKKKSQFRIFIAYYLGKTRLIDNI